MGDIANEPAVGGLLLSILVQVLPLCILKVKLLNASNILSLLSRTASKILFMHISVLTLRVVLLPLVMYWFPEHNQGIDHAPGEVWVNASCLLSAIYIMSVVCGFRWTTVEFFSHTDIALLHILGMVHCLFSVLCFLSESSRGNIQSWATQYTESMETLAYMPAIWMMFQTDQKLLAFEELSQMVSQRQSV